MADALVVLCECSAGLAVTWPCSKPAASPTGTVSYYGCTPNIMQRRAQSLRDGAIPNQML